VLHFISNLPLNSDNKKSSSQDDRKTYYETAHGERIPYKAGGICPVAFGVKE